ncbi:putative sporulation protein YtxC [Heyndrickxia ginsengihumi]|uniref:putative sporulation protein YtxC n=1 Tax=Heyndrickxia ginsengihumi TaxID=363870 RepID=UPI0004725AB5|nr:putative sporulation protein YtxC [Heyndrickxia ginsengihumi]
MDLIFKYMKDALWLQQYFCEHFEEDINVYETLFQNQEHALATIPDDQGASKGKVKDAIIQLILSKKRNEWIRKRLSEFYYFTEEQEQNNILEIIIDMLNGSRKELLAFVKRLDEPNELEKAVYSSLESDTVSIDSLLTFRLKEYFERLETYIEIAIDEYKMEQDYQIYVQTLRDYLKNREARIAHINLYFEEYGKFYNEQYQEISKNEMSELLDRRLLTNHPIYIDSATIAPLLSIAPTNIFIYTNEPDSGLIRTICNIFEERVTILSKEIFLQAKKHPRVLNES